MSAAAIAPPMCARYYRDKAVTWLWPNRFAIKRLGIIAGLPDEGKGQIYFLPLPQASNWAATRPMSKNSV
jgi:hypothetical protein